MLKELKLMIELIPSLIKIITSVETALPEAGRGQQKMEFVRELLESLYPEIMEHWETISKVITSLVKLFNQVGVFKQSESQSS